MEKITPKKIFLKDYEPSNFNIEKIDLEFDIYEDYTQVKNTSFFKKNLNSNKNNQLALDGINLELISLRINNKIYEDYNLEKNKLVINNLPDSFELQTIVKIDPKNNKQLMGLYKSDNILCTQNEPEGFRRITYHLDRSDVMSMYSTTLIADKEKYPILLSNGNKIEEKDLENGRHMVKWQDPFKKPCYLFAVVAGDLICTKDNFITKSNRNIDLQIYTDKGNETRVSHAMNSLKKAMKWDEERFDREYDLDIFMVVAVDSFNSGAMENKGLNIFNSSAILCDQKTATDSDFQYIEAVVAHEYFHNWTGNRITCRDWFQLTLKEGLTVFRDSEFSSDMQDRSIKRIEDTKYIKEGQFPEDAGPMSHAIQPQAFIDIENFYTVTVYEKGAEVIRMLKTLYGEEKFKKALGLYFDTFDGQAVTINEFLWSFEKSLNIDLTQFKDSWYKQAGTPKIEYEEFFDKETKEYRLKIKQSCPFPKKDNEKPYFFPLSYGLLNKYGDEVKKGIIKISKEEETFSFKDFSHKPTPSLLQGFSAPVDIKYNYSMEENIFLFNNDKDPVNKYEAGQRIIKNIILGLIDNPEMIISDEIIKAYKSILQDTNLSSAFKSYCFFTPSLYTITKELEFFDYKKAYNAKKQYVKFISNNLTDIFNYTFHNNQNTEYSINSEAIGNRSLKNTCLAYLSENDKDFTNLINTQFETANNMTDKISALSLLCKKENIIKTNALFEFKNEWKENSLVMNKWISVQMSAPVENILELSKKLEKDEVFDITNPNKVRALLGSFGGNKAFFHNKDGKNYEYFKNKILELDKLNSKISSGLSQVFRDYSKLRPEIQSAMKPNLELILNTKDISSSLYEVINAIIESEKK
jgi:aminopeptidase N